MDKAGIGARKAKGLIVFDVEGVLLPKRRYIPFEATKKLGLPKFLKILFFGLLYEVGLIPLEAALKQIYKYFKGYNIKELQYYYEKMPLLPDSTRVLKFLHENGWKTALISSGLPDIFIRELAIKLKADYHFGLKLKTVNGKFTGEIQGDVIKKNGKSIVLKEILRREDISPHNCILIADDRNNLQMFKHADLKIGYNPDFMITTKSDYIVTGRLGKILPIITQTKTEKTKPPLSTNQILRETIHISGFAIPFICTYLLNRHQVTLIILLITLIYTMSELSRITGTTFPILTWITSHATVRLEQYEFAATPIFYALGIILSLTIFPPAAGYASIAILTLGDSSAALFGRKIGKTHYPFNKAKSLEGSIIGFIFAFLGAILFVNPNIALVGAITGILTEILPTPISDNLTIPLTSGAIITLTLI